MFKKNVTTLIVITIFSQLLKSQFLIYQIKKWQIHNILTLISQQIIGKLLLMDSTGATVLLVYSTGTVAIVPNLFYFIFFSNRFVFFFFFFEIFM